MIAMDFAVLPPEVNSGRMYAGAGAGPLMAASVAWDGLAAELGSAAASYRAVVAELTSQPWLGPAAASMAAAAAPYVAWMDGTGVQAEQAAVQARAAVAAYEAAFAATVPPPMIEANRALVMSLVATNLLGQNSAAIAAAEAQYAQMWAQDVAAMVGYAAGAEAASVSLTPFSVQAPTTSATGIAAQAAAVDQAVVSGGMQSAQTTAAEAAQASSPLSWLENWLLQILQSQPVADFRAIVQGVAGYGGFFQLMTQAMGGTLLVISPSVNAAEAGGIAARGKQAVQAAIAAGAAAAAAPSAATSAAAIRPAGADAAAMMGRAASLGGLSVPQSLATSSQAVRLAASALPMDAARTAAPAGMLSGLPMMGSVVNAPRNGESRQQAGSRLRVLPFTKAGQQAPDDDTDDTDNGELAATTAAAEVGDAPTERDELNELRAAVAGLARERDVLHRSASMLIRTAMDR